MTGVDVSYWQGAINWQKAQSAGIKFAFIRSTMGATGEDGYWQSNRDGIAQTNILPGAYHYYLDNRSPLEQARWFSSHVPDGWVPVIDLEDKNAERGTVGNRIKMFLDECERIMGVKPLIYTAAWWWNPYVGNVPWAKEYPLWVANYLGANDGTPPPAGAKPIIPAGWNDWAIWQYTSGANGPAYGVSSARLDLNRFRGDSATLQAFWAQHARGGTVTPPPPPPPLTGKYRVTASVLNVRSGPGTGNADIGDTYRGAVWEGTGAREGDWVEVKAWVHRDYVEEA